jgi:hypothetical protein
LLAAVSSQLSVPEGVLFGELRRDGDLAVGRKRASSKLSDVGLGSRQHFCKAVNAFIVAK